MAAYIFVQPNSPKITVVHAPNEEKAWRRLATQFGFRDTASLRHIKEYFSGDGIEIRGPDNIVEII